jgi:hypothetical protein
MLRFPAEGSTTRHLFELTTTRLHSKVHFGPLPAIKATVRTESIVKTLIILNIPSTLSSFKHGAACLSAATRRITMKHTLHEIA